MFTISDQVSSSAEPGVQLRVTGRRRSTVASLTESFTSGAPKTLTLDVKDLHATQRKGIKKWLPSNKKEKERMTGLKRELEMDQHKVSLEDLCRRYDTNPQTVSSSRLIIYSNPNSFFYSQLRD